MSASTGGAYARPVGAPRADARRDVGLRAHRVEGHDAAADVEQVQKRRNRRDLVRFGVDSLLREHQLLLARPRRDHMQHRPRVVLVVAALQRLAVDGDDLALDLGRHGLDPPREAALERLRLDGRDDAADGVG